MFARLVPIVLGSMLLVTACEKTDHESIDKWMKTKKGPAKLRKACLDEGMDADLSSHACVNMIRTGKLDEVKTEFDHMPPPRRQALVAKMAPKLWDIARIEGEMQMPAPHQTQAKDALFTLRKYADDATRTQIDGYMIDWYTTPAFEGRANAGAFSGLIVMRTVGAPAAVKLMRVADGIIAAPGQETVKKKIGDELLLSLAATGDPAAVKYVLDIARMDRGDKTLSERAMSALFRVYVDPQGEFDPQPPTALVPHMEALVSIAKDPNMPAHPANDAVALIRVVGPPACLPPLMSMIAVAHTDPSFRYVGPDAALKCGGVKAIKQVVQAMPEVPYDRESLSGSVINAIAKMSPRDQVLVELRDLLSDNSRVARWVAVEALAAMKSVEDAPRIAAVKGPEKLSGYWGQGSLKPDPTLAERAKELAAQLQSAPK